MVTGVLDRPGLRLTRAELLAQRGAAPVKPCVPTTRRPGGRAGKPPGTGMDLREIRLFGDGDDPRRIDPSATARTGQLHVRGFHEDRDDTTLLIADFRRAMLWGTGTRLRSVRAARLLARLGWQATQRGGAVGLLVLTEVAPLTLAFASGEAQMIAISSVMAAQHDEALSAHPPALDGMAETLGHAARMAPSGAEVHLATGFDSLDPALDPALKRLTRKRRLVVHIILDPIETDPPAHALLVSNDGATRHGQLLPLDFTPLAERLHGLGAMARKVLPDDP